MAALVLSVCPALHPFAESRPNVPFMHSDTHAPKSALKLPMACFYEHILFPDGGHE